MPEPNKTEERKSLLFRIPLYIIALLIFFGTFSGIRKYSRHINLFTLEKVVVYGADSVDSEEIIKLTNVRAGMPMFSLCMDSIRTRVLSHPHIEAARVSRTFPRALVIRVRERKPIALINYGDIYSVDSGGFIMKHPSRENEISLPILSGFTAKDSLLLNQQTTNRKLLKMLTVLNEIRRSNSAVFPQISELVNTQGNKYILYTADSATRIYLGETDFAKKVRLLEAFWATLRDKKEWHDFEYIDLRYHKQVIVQERT